MADAPTSTKGKGKGKGASTDIGATMVEQYSPTAEDAAKKRANEARAAVQQAVQAGLIGNNMPADIVKSISPGTPGGAGKATAGGARKSQLSTDLLAQKEACAASTTAGSAAASKVEYIASQQAMALSGRLTLPEQLPDPDRRILAALQQLVQAQTLDEHYKVGQGPVEGHVLISLTLADRLIS